MEMKWISELLITECLDLVGGFRNSREIALHPHDSAHDSDTLCCVMKGGTQNFIVLHKHFQTLKEAISKHFALNLDDTLDCIRCLNGLFLEYAEAFLLR